MREHLTQSQQTLIGEGSVRLILIGLAMQIIYVVYIVAFPLISNTQAGGPAADLEILMRDNRWFAPIYVMGILLLYYLFWQAMQWAQNLSRLASHVSRLTFHAFLPHHAIRIRRIP